MQTHKNELNWKDKSLQQPFKNAVKAIASIFCNNIEAFTEIR